MQCNPKLLLISSYNLPITLCWLINLFKSYEQSKYCSEIEVRFFCTSLYQETRSHGQRIVNIFKCLFLRLLDVARCGRWVRVAALRNVLQFEAYLSSVKIGTLATHIWCAISMCDDMCLRASDDWQSSSWTHYCVIATTYAFILTNLFS